jgi:hypothetical protein
MNFHVPLNEYELKTMWKRRGFNLDLSFVIPFRLSGIFILPGKIVLNLFKEQVKILSI